MRPIFALAGATLGGLIVTASPNASYGQLVREHDAQSLRSFHGGASHIRRSFESDAEARNVLRQILAAAGLAGMEDRIFLRASAETANAEASIEKDERFIFYNAVFMQDLAKQTKDYWPMVAVLAHEVGHHIRLHTVIPGRAHVFELEADYSAGYILRRLGANLEQAQAAYRTFPEGATTTHPDRAQRLQAVTIGWTVGGSTQVPSWAQPPQAVSQVAAIPPPSRPVPPAPSQQENKASSCSGRIAGSWDVSTAVTFPATLVMRQYGGWKWELKPDGPVGGEAIWKDGSERKRYRCQGNVYTFEDFFGITLRLSPDGRRGDYNDCGQRF